MKFVLAAHKASDGLDHFIEILKEIRSDPEVLAELAANPKKSKGFKKKKYTLPGFGPYCNDVIFEYFIVGNAKEDGTYVLNTASVAELQKHHIGVLQKDHCVYFDLGEFLI